MRARSPFLPVLLVGLLALGASAQPAEPPAEAERLEAGPFGLALWVATEDQGVDARVLPGGNGTLWFAFLAPPPGEANGTREPPPGEEPPENATGEANATVYTSFTAYVNLSSEAVAFESANLTVSWPAGEGWAFLPAAFAVAEDAREQAPYAYAVELWGQTEEGSVLLAIPSGAGAVGQEAVDVPAPPPSGVPLPWLVAGGGAVVVGGGAALYALRQREMRRRMNAAPRRSQVMREMVLERELERIQEKEPERVEEIRQEIRAQEQIREKRRDLQIMEAKRADALKTLELLRKRHEMGGLTRLQYEQMAAKKQKDLERIEAEIAQMEREGGGAAA